MKGRSTSRMHAVIDLTQTNAGSTNYVVVKFRAVGDEEISESKKPEEELLLSWNDVQKMKYAWAVVCEAMRVVPPVLGTFRSHSRLFICWLHCSKGVEGMYVYYQCVFWTVNTTQRNPEHFQEPNKFDPSRFMKGIEGMPLYTYVPFGGGPRMCPGK
ncbi:hypothetical protein RHSIM_Rhsim01G0195000 [Rhododendron simsii]|uniref:Uncharacterized protein n=1 Tax=Rhododendron simsii TaxID=118357 RepID=A0A834HH04_RHOSS|nr:hypothetical protein RHSIM_Rhsim01G0195000 [Rhododendron simsii]